MIAFLKGKIERLTPTCVWLDCNHVGYEIQISLKTYEKLKDTEQAFLYIHLQIREDAHILYGFHTEIELGLFKLLIQISGISGTMARMMLSSLLPTEMIKIIHAQDIIALKKIKGIGTKTAERVLLELKGKIDVITTLAGYTEQALDDPIPTSSRQPKIQDAIQALQALGINKNQAVQICEKIEHQINEQDSVETIIKLALQEI